MGPKFFDPLFFGSPIVLLPKFFWDPNFLGPIFFFWIQFFLGPKFFGTQIFSRHNFFGSKIFSWPKFFWDLNLFVNQHFLGHKIFRTRNPRDQKIVWDPKIPWTQSSWDREYLDKTFLNPNSLVSNILWDQKKKISDTKFLRTIKKNSVPKPFRTQSFSGPTLYTMYAQDLVHYLKQMSNIYTERAQY